MVNIEHSTLDKTIDIWKSFWQEKYQRMISCVQERPRVIVQKQDQHITKHDHEYHHVMENACQQFMNRMRILTKMKLALLSLIKIAKSLNCICHLTKLSIQRIIPIESKITSPLLISTQQTYEEPLISRRRSP